MAFTENGDKLKFPGIAADVHFIDEGTSGSAALLVVAIVAAAGFTIPKIAIKENTTAGGVADVMGVLAPVNFSHEQIKHLVHKTRACIASEDESYSPVTEADSDRRLSSTVAKYIQSGINHLVIDLPYGDYHRFRDLKEAESFKHKVTNLAEQFHITLHVYIHKADEPTARGIGPVLSARDLLRVLEQHDVRPRELETYSLHLAGKLLDLCFEGPHSDGDLKKRITNEFGSCLHWAQYILRSGHALKKTREIIRAQGGDGEISSEVLKPGKFFFDVPADQDTTIARINSRNTILIAKILGAPKYKKSGIYIHCTSGEQVAAGQTLFTLYSEHAYNLEEAKDSLGNFPLYY